MIEPILAVQDAHQLELRREWMADKTEWDYMIAEGCLGCGAKLTDKSAVCHMEDVYCEERPLCDNYAKALVCRSCADLRHENAEYDPDDVRWRVVWNRIEEAVASRPEEWKERLTEGTPNPESMEQELKFLLSWNKELHGLVAHMAARLTALEQREPYTAPKVAPSWLKVDQTQQYPQH